MRCSLVRCLFLTTLFLCLESVLGDGGGTTLYGQTVEKLEQRYEVDDVRFVGNEFMSTSDLMNVISTRETPGGFWKFVYRTVSESIGKEPQYFDEFVFREDIHKLKGFYRDNGFFSAQIDTTVRFNREQQNVVLTFNIREGAQAHIDSTTYRGLDSLPPAVHEEIMREVRVEKNDPYNVARIQEDIYRILNVLYNNGYPNAQNDSVLVGLKASNHNVIVVAAFSTGPYILFGDITVKFERPMDLDFEIIERQLDFKTDLPYSAESVRSLNRLGAFEYARINVEIPSGGDTTKRAPVTIVLKPKDKFEVTPEILVNNQDNAFNLGLGIGGTVRNILGGAQNLTTRLGGQAQSLDRGNAELSVQFIQPYFFSNRLSLNWTASARLDIQKEYRQTVISNKIGVVNKLPWYFFFSYSFLDWTIEHVDVSFSQEFTDRLLSNAQISNDTLFITDSAAVAVLERLKEPQSNSIISITVQHDQTNDIFSPTAGAFLSFTAEESGSLPALLIKDRTKLPFSQYYKLVVLTKWFTPISSDTASVLGMKLKVGFAEQYGSDRDKYPIPTNRRFFAGGSNSVRGWRARGLGAGIDPAFGGQAILEANLEARMRPFRYAGKVGFLEGKNLGLVFFCDLGNVWNNYRNVNVQEVAIAAGIGLRYDVFFGPVRIDFGVQVFDPIASTNRWIWERQLWSETLRQGNLHVGIGHAF
jgi:outer membrane protein insertion porin family